MKRACRRAASILTVSEFTRNQIIDWSGVPAQKVLNVSCGVDSAYGPEGDSYAMPFPYLLCVSNRKRHKNEFRIVHAFAEASLDPEMHLVFTGNADTDLNAWIGRHQVDSRVNFAGIVPEAKMPSLYRGAKALIFPSLYEGFGLPVLEAMACGTPVVTANVTAMPEVAADAALLVDPTRVEQIVNAIEQIAGDDALRIRLQERGLKRAGDFSWTAKVDRVHKLLLAKQI